jgi:hypothetical protein
MTVGHPTFLQALIWAGRKHRPSAGVKEYSRKRFKARSLTMIEMHLSGMKARNGTLIFVCSTCKTPPNFTFGAQGKGELALLMLCPKCGIVLGEWNSVEARDRELGEFAKTLRSHAPFQAL